jgi:NADPH:quinone reductase-like Zn-dependent oxidoreductase
MRAAICTSYGPPDVVRIEELPTPVPAGGELLVRIHATTVSSADSRIRSMTMPRGFGLPARLMFGVTRPRQPVLGMELAGVVEAVGRDVKEFKVGDAVFAPAGAKMGGHAEYRCLPAAGPVAHVPSGLDIGQAAALCFGGLTALSFFRRAQLTSGERVLVNGASGCVGTAAVQLARHFGAEVTGVTSTRNLELVRSLGAADVIDYTQADFTQIGERYDVIVDTVGTAPYRHSRHALASGGRLLLVLGDLADLLSAPWYSIGTGHKVIAGPSSERVEDVRFLAELAGSGAYRPVIDRSFPLDAIVDAHRYVDTGRKRGNVVVTPAA